MLIKDIEWHDARLSEIVVSASGDGVIRFRHICAYFAVVDDCEEVWSCEASVVLSTVNKMSIIGTMCYDDYVSDAYLFDANGQDVSLLPVGSIKDASSLKVIFGGSGTSIEINMKKAMLRSLDRVRKLENF